MDMIEEYEERKRLRRSRFRWRVVAIVAVIAALTALWSQRSLPKGQHIARFTVDGIITDDPGRDDLLKALAEDESVEAVIVSIDSPGGTVVGSEILHDSLRKVAEKKPMVAVMRNVAASGGYMAAIAADHIIARGNTVTGSIGVISQSPNAHELMERIGVSILEVKSGSLKAQPSPFHPIEAQAVEAKQEMIAESFAWFLDLVQSRRELSENALGAIRDGGVFTGRQAVKISLIDALGGEDEAVAWLESERGIAADRDILDYRRPEKGMLATLFDLIGLGRGEALMLSPGLYAIYR